MRVNPSWVPMIPDSVWNSRLTGTTVEIGLPETRQKTELSADIFFFVDSRKCIWAFVGRAARGSGIAAFSSIFTNPHRVEGGKRRRTSTVVSAIFALPPSTEATWAPKMRQKKSKKTSFSPKSALNHSLRSVFLLKSTFWHRLVFFDFHVRRH